MNCTREGTLPCAISNGFIVDKIIMVLDHDGSESLLVIAFRYFLVFRRQLSSAPKSKIRFKNGKNGSLRFGQDNRLNQFAIKAAPTYLIMKE